MTGHAADVVERPFPRLRRAVEQGIDRRLHTGVQVCICQHGEWVLNAGFGTAGDGRPLTAGTLMPWRSAGKPVTAAFAVHCVERELFGLDTRLGELLPEAEETPVGRLTIHHVLTHTTGLSSSDVGWPHTAWSESVRRVLSMTPQRDESPAAYDPQAGWFLLAECVRRVRNHRTSFAQLLTDDWLSPIGLHDVHCGIGANVREQRAHDLPVIYERSGGQLRPSDHSDGPWLTQPSAGGNLRGPVSELAGFYEFLRKSLRALNGNRLLRPGSVRRMTERHRQNQYDATLQHKVDFGLGVIVDSSRYGADTVPYGFGRNCSELTFGHGGAQCAMGFCDPQHELVVCWSANGFCGEGHHQRRNAAINTAIYQDLGLG